MKCLFCEEIYSDIDIKDMNEMNDAFYMDKDMFICPDCFDDFNRLDAEQQIDAIFNEELPENR
ncbi:hypothetical protein FACS1894105_04210 [Clostridia bacterium]|nr:hypothetical protein FACS1894105_04210 [Clostridia bacterium]